MAISSTFRSLCRLLFAGTAWAALLGYSREFVFSQALKPESVEGIAVSLLTGIEFYQGQPLMITLYLAILVLCSLAVAAALIDHIILASLFEVGFIVCVILDAMYLKQTYALILGCTAAFFGALFIAILLMR